MRHPWWMVVVVACARPPLVSAPATPASTPAASTWTIHPDGVGPIAAGGDLPARVWEMAGKTRQQLVDAPLRGKTELQAMVAGLKNQEGHRTLRLTQADLTIVLTTDGRIRGLWPGPSLRTAEGTGIGSTLDALVAAHGDATLTRFPEPHECGVRVPGYGGVTFLFCTCEDAQEGGVVRAVYLHGDDDPEDRSP